MSGGRGAIRVTGLRELLRDLNHLGPALNREVRVASREIAETEAGRIKAQAAGSDKLSAAVGVSVRTRSDRVPTIIAGGAKRAAVSGRPKAGDVFFGAEFGGQRRKTTRQFRPHLKKQGYWMWPQIREDEAAMQRTWLEAVDRLLEQTAFLDRGR